RHSDDRKQAQREDHPDIAVVGIPEALQHGGVSTSLRSSMPPDLALRLFRSRVGNQLKLTGSYGKKDGRICPPGGDAPSRMRPDEPVVRLVCVLRRLSLTLIPALRSQHCTSPSPKKKR
ncbi:MAG TPA: hypothetical protein VFE80_06915, partial [Beijerinckiaceae bacterium]|nr:hypothetical protein [Beijerinckiaceae bacterium]